MNFKSAKKKKKKCKVFNFEFKKSLFSRFKSHYLQLNMFINE